MAFLGKEFPESIPPIILAFCSVHPSHQYTGLAAACQDCHAHWRRMLIKKARDAFASFHDFRSHTLTQWGLHGRPPRNSPIEDRAIRTLNDIAEMLGLRNGVIYFDVTLFVTFRPRWKNCPWFFWLFYSS